ncbi:WcaI family glycosyltransferase [Ekhidna sp.]|uniref:WcaI family glycosyltransferase n=1 Tax=Ekhidna sp. TaxID=2608089 RepID=UPI003BABE38C
MKKVTLYSYYSPEELTGIGKYNGELIKWLLQNDIEVTSISNAPFYPHWKIYPGFGNQIYSKKKYSYEDIRTWVYIPPNPGALKKIISELSFVISSTFALVMNIKGIRKSSLLIVINPPFFLGLLPYFLIIGSKCRILLHIQDLQIDAARELNLLPITVCRFLEVIEKWLLKKVDFVSTISIGMAKKIDSKNIGKKVMLLPNWSELKQIFPIENCTWLHDHLGILKSRKLVVYSGNIGEKQGLDNLVKAANLLKANNEIHFIVLGEGVYRKKLENLINKYDLDNFTLGSLVPKENMNEMLNSSYIQVVIQKGQSTESFLPSKLTNILASGTASIVTANEGTTLHTILSSTNSAVLIDPDNPESLANQILNLCSDNDLRKKIKNNARLWAEDNLAINKCLKPLSEILG